MPFVTEELWQRLPHPHSLSHPALASSPQDAADRRQSNTQASSSDRMSIMVQPYPQVQQAWRSSETEAHMQQADSIVRAVRKLRNDYGLQRQRPQLFIQVGSTCPVLSNAEYCSERISSELSK